MVIDQSRTAQATAMLMASIHGADVICRLIQASENCSGRVGVRVKEPMAHNQRQSLLEEYGMMLADGSSRHSLSSPGSVPQCPRTVLPVGGKQPAPG